MNFKITKAMEPIPEINKTYSFFRDGKIKLSRHCKVTVLNIIPFEKMDVGDVKELWKAEIKECDWLYAPQTDYFIIGGVEGDDDGIQYFVRTVDGEWFSLGDFSGLLDVTDEYAKFIS